MRRNAIDRLHVAVRQLDAESSWITADVHESLPCWGGVHAVPRDNLSATVPGSFEKAGVNTECAKVAVAHGVLYILATELAQVSFDAPMKLLGHESMVASQRYVDGSDFVLEPWVARRTYRQHMLVLIASLT
ncbi:MAG: hypothetical protein ABW137_34300 [Mycobacterium sp.]